MSRRFSRIIALTCAVFLMASLFCVNGFAANDETGYEKICIYVDGEFNSYGLKVNTTTYVPIRAFCEALSAEVDWNGDDSTVTVTIEEGVTITATVDDQYMCVNGRYLYLPDGVIAMAGYVVVPIREIARAFNVDIEWNADDWTINVNTANMSVLESGDSFYDEDELYWMSQIIYAEAGNQPLEGMIGVGNVVTNRVADETFPDTIEDVICQPGQFDPVTNKAIYSMTPNELSVVAAKICLEGYNTVGDSLFFVNPATGSVSWFDSHRTYVCTLQDHAFYN